MPEEQTTFDDFKTNKSEDIKGTEVAAKSNGEDKEEEALTYSNDEALARQQGWRPKDEWEGDPDKWVDYSEFNFRGELFDKISNLVQDNKALRTKAVNQDEAIRFLAEQAKKQTEREYNSKIDDLKKQKVQALEEDDKQAVVEIDDQITDLKVAKKEAETEQKKEEPEQQPQDQQVDPRVQQWVDDQAWWGKNKPMTAKAQALSTEYVYLQQLNGNETWDVSKMIEFVEDGLQQAYPQEYGISNQRFANVNVPNPNNTNPRRKRGKHSAKDLSTEQLRIAETIVEAGGAESVDAYVQDFFKDDNFVAEFKD